jgi:hypothetical protein
VDADRDGDEHADRYRDEYADVDADCDKSTDMDAVADMDQATNLALPDVFAGNDAAMFALGDSDDAAIAGGDAGAVNGLPGVVDAARAAARHGCARIARMSVRPLNSATLRLV